MNRISLCILLLLAHRATGQSYWQQQVDTRIQVRLDDEGHTLMAHEEFTYTNNSPDTLRSIYIHLWPNAYRDDRTPFARQLDEQGTTGFYYSKPDDKGYIDSLLFTVDGHFAENYIAENTPDIARIDLPEPLLPGRKIMVATPFKVKIPTECSRLGHNGQAYFISQWFPKPAVYDAKGWHPISYLHQGEFYSEYGTYDVSITLPSNYVVMATGNCLDASENQWMDSLATKADLIDSMGDQGTPPSSTTYKTLRFHEDNIHDFAWFADKRWVLRKDTVMSPGNNTPITLWAAHLPEYGKSWTKATGYLKETVKHYGKWVGPYPYKTLKTAQGDMKAGGGMEYPTLAVIDRAANSELRTVIIHEAGHNWFYGILGSNERDHPWQDEGMNTFYEKKTSRDLESEKGIIAKVTTLNEDLLYYELAATHTDMPIELPAANYPKLNYGIDVYYKTALMMRWLEQYMGEDAFERAMHEYYSQWHHKHPYPADFRACMQHQSKESLDWFFDGIMHTSKKIDFTITHAKVGASGTDVKLLNRHGLPAPVKINYYQKDSLLGSVWSPVFTGSTHITIPSTAWTTLQEDEVNPDAKLANSFYKRSGLWHRKGLKVKPFFGLNRSEKEKLFISPAFGYNQYDGFMAGLLLHDLSVPENRFRFALAPLYSFELNTFVGAGSVAYVWYPSSIFQNIMLQADAKTFHTAEAPNVDGQVTSAGFRKLAPSISFDFHQPDPLSSAHTGVSLRYYNISEENISLGLNGMAAAKTYTQVYNYGVLRLMHENNRTYNPFGYNLEAQASPDFVKLCLEGTATVNYNKPNKALYVRAFLGKFLAINNDLATIQRYELNASYSGSDDYLYDGTYLGRNAYGKLAANQVGIKEGGFTIPVHDAVYRSDNWMATINLKTDLPKVRSLRLYLNAGLVPNANPSFAHNSSTTLLYEGGAQLHLLGDFIQINIPVIMSGDFRDYLLNTYGHKHFFDRSLSFSINFLDTNWMRSSSKLLKRVG